MEVEVVYRMRVCAIFIGFPPFFAVFVIYTYSVFLRRFRCYFPAYCKRAWGGYRRLGRARKKLGDWMGAKTEMACICHKRFDHNP